MYQKYLDKIHYIKPGQSIRLEDYEFCVGIESECDVFIFLLNNKGELISDDHLLFYNSKLRVGEDGKSDYDSNSNDERNYHAISPDKAIIGPFENEAHSFYDSYELRRSYVNLSELSKDVFQIIFCISDFEKMNNPQNNGFENDFHHVRLFKNADWLFGTRIGDTIACTDFTNGIECTVSLKEYRWEENEYFQNVLSRTTYPDLKDYAAIELVQINKVEGYWEFKSVGTPYKSVSDLINKYYKD